jgi:hypothetical protein
MPQQRGPGTKSRFFSTALVICFHDIPHVTVIIDLVLLNATVQRLSLRCPGGLGVTTAVGYSLTSANTRCGRDAGVATHSWLCLIFRTPSFNCLFHRLRICFVLFFDGMITIAFLVL